MPNRVVEQVGDRLAEATRIPFTDLTALGYECIPSECNFFMVHIKRQIQPTIEDFRKRGVLVGRPFPPMLEHMRVSVGTADEMNRFMVAFKEIFAGARSTSAQ